MRWVAVALMAVGAVALMAVGAVAGSAALVGSIAWDWRPRI